MRDPLSRGFAPVKDVPDIIQPLLKKRAEQRIEAEKAPEMKFDEMSELGGVWEKDVEPLSNEFISYKKKVIEYEREKDPTKKGSLWQEAVKMGAKLKTNIEKSKKNKVQYVTKAEQINKDNKLLYPEDATEKLDKWANTSIYDRPDNIGIEIPSTIDFGKEFIARLKPLVKYSVAETDTKVGDKIIKKGDRYIKEEDWENAGKQVISTMPENIRRAFIYNTAQRASDPDPNISLEATQALQNPQSITSYMTKFGLGYAAPYQEYSIYKVRPDAEKKAAGGGGKSDKFSVSYGRQAFQLPDKTTTEDYYTVDSRPIGKSPINQDWYVSKDVLRRMKDSGAFTASADIESLPENIAVQGSFVRAVQNVNTGEKFIIINSKDFADKYGAAQPTIVLPLQGNEAAFEANLNGKTAEQAFKEAVAKQGGQRKFETVPTPKQPGSKPPPKENKGTVVTEGGRRVWKPGK